MSKTPKKNPHAVALGRLGGQVTGKQSPAKAEASRRNARRPRPRRKKQQA
jgi:hypothetical protein